MISFLDLEELYEQVTGRKMRKEDREALRLLLSHMPGALGDSPSYMFDLVVKYHQWQQLRETIAAASDEIVGDVERQSEQAVSKLIDKSVARIHASAPSQTAAFYRAIVAACVLVVICVMLTAIGIFGAISHGLMVPPWLSEEAAGKVAWAEAVEARVGPGSIDWTMREGQPDTSLLDILRYLEQRGTEIDPVRQLAEIRRCSSPGAVAYRRAGKSMCRFQLGEP